MELNDYGKRWVESHYKATVSKEDEIYASIGAYDRQAFLDFLKIEQERLTVIALRHQDDPEFQLHVSRLG